MSAGSTTNPEAQPLLSPSKPPTYHDEHIQDPSRTVGGSDEESGDTLVADDADAPKTRSWSMIAFQSVIVLLSLIVVGLFIKGFIDAGDVEVWFYLEWCSRWKLLIHTRFACPSSTWERLSRVHSVVDSVAPQVRVSGMDLNVEQQLMFSYLAMVLQVLTLMVNADKRLYLTVLSGPHSLCGQS